ncbi:MAG: hypothetical protein FJ350_07035, partial [Sphingomonadales bacterium]|nr:hypothetical protein [Sphingomonadales bacterium]MBM3923349.1 hypothetical protein [Sphingomonadales bacterium]
MSAKGLFHTPMCWTWIGMIWAVTACSDSNQGAERFKIKPEVGVDRMERVDLWFYQSGFEKAHLKAG